MKELTSGFMSLILLLRIKEQSLSSLQRDLPYTQSLLDFAQKEIDAKSSTCFSRLRLLRVAGFISESQGNRNGKGVIGYQITDSGEKLLAELIIRASELLKICEKMNGGKKYE
jgi:DNA-binding PadR family transcriptional regulator